MTEQRNNGAGTMPKQIKDTPQYMQFAYGAQPSPLAGAQLIFLNELLEVLEEFKTVARETKSDDLTPAVAALSDQIRQSVNEIKQAIAAAKPKAQSLAPITKGLKALADRPTNAAEMARLSAALDALLSSSNAVLDQLQDMAKPRKWTFDINRDALHGHIVSVTAQSKPA